MTRPEDFKHLKLERVSVQGPRRTQTNGFGGSGRNASSHSTALTDAARLLITATKARPPVLGIDPQLVMVIETEPTKIGVDQESSWSRSGLRVVDSATDHQVVAFSEDAELGAFLDRLQQYGEIPPEGQKNHRYASFFDSILEIRQFGRADRIGPELAAELSTEADLDKYLADIEVWYHGESEISFSWLTEVSAAVSRGGGRVLDQFISDTAGVSLLRIEATIEIISVLADLDLIADIELVVEAGFDVASFANLEADDLVNVPQVSEDAPVVGILDSGVLAGHPLLAGSVLDAVALSAEFSSGSDENGHGTAVSSLVSHGPLEAGLASGDWSPTVCAVLSVKILDANNQLPYSSLPAREIDQAVRYLAARAIRVINLSIGDQGAIFGGRRAAQLAAVLDSLSRELQIVLIVPTGNITPASYYIPFDGQMSQKYAGKLVDSPKSSLLDPAPAALALTVGATVPPHGPLAIDRRALGGNGWPAPFSRRGPGLGGATKPELTAPGGTLTVQLGTSVLLQDPITSIAVADGRPGTATLVTGMCGTSLAAPLVARAAAIIEAAYPSTSSNLIRALTLQATTPAEANFDESTITGKIRNERARQLLGYGSLKESAAIAGDEFDVTLMAEDTISVNGVHLYAIPIPNSFFVSGNSLSRGITVTLAFDPPTRARRLDYTGSRMSFEVVRGIPPQQVLELFLKDMEAGDQGGSRVTDLGATQRLRLFPSATQRKLGANQVGRLSWKRALKRSGGEELLLVVQNINRWDSAFALQPYAVTTRLWSAPALGQIRDEMRLRVDAARARVSVEIEV